MQAKAAVLRASGVPLEVLTVTVDDPGPGQVRVRLSACGLCHTDQSVLEGVLPAMNALVMGHEGAGVVESVGEGVTTLAPGDHVIMTTTAFCGRCLQCVEGQYAQCERMPLTNNTSTPFHLDDADLTPFASVGGLSEYTVVAENTAIKIADDIPLLSASLLGCGVITGVGAAINTAGVRPGTSCAVWGAGGVGLSVIQGCRIAGASTIVSIDANPDKLDLASRVGATHVVDASSENALERVLGLTGGRGADVVYDGVGRDSFAHSVAALAVGGRLVSFGQASGDVGPYDVGSLAAKSATISRPDFAHYTDTPEKVTAITRRLFDAIERRIVRVGIGRRYPLREAAEAHRALEAGETVGSTILVPEAKGAGFG